MKSTRLTAKAIALAGLSIAAGQASAHWSSGPFLYNDAGTNPMFLANTNLALGVPAIGPATLADGTANPNAAGTFGTNVGTGTSYGTYTQLRSVSSDYGWIQGQNNVEWANSHDNKGLAFSLAGPSTVSFTVTTLGTAPSVVQTQATGGTTVTTLSGLDWTPAFSLFKGLATQSSHEGGIGNVTLDENLPGYAPWGPYAAQHPVSPATIATFNAGAARDPSNPNIPYVGDGTWGAYRSNGDWVAGRDISATARFGDGTLIGTDQTLGGQNVRVLDYISSARAADGAHSVTASFTLDAGDYSLWVGGTNAANAALQKQNYLTLFSATTDRAAAQTAYDAALAAAGGNTADPAVVAAQTTLTNATAATTAATAAVAALRVGYGFSIETTVSAVPVPAAVWLFGSAFAGFSVFGRRKQAAKSA